MDGEPPEHLIRNCLESLGISHLIEWDILVFVQRHGISLTSAQRLALLLGCEITAVEGALNRLAREKLIERSRTSQGARFFRIPRSTDPERRYSFEQLVTVSESRAGRLLVRNQMNALRSESLRFEQSTWSLE
jgi:hypothetical protein